MVQGILILVYSELLNAHKDGNFPHYNMAGDVICWPIRFMLVYLTIL